MTDDRSDATYQRHIVVAEDDAETRELVAYVLRAAGYRVTEFADGRTLLEFVVTTRDHIDLLLTDVHMPKLSGLDVLDECRAQSRFLPTVLMTAYGDDYTRAAASRNGAIGVLDKPLDLQDLRGVVNVLTGGWEPQRAEGRDSTPEAQSEEQQWAGQYYGRRTE